MKGSAFGGDGGSTALWLGADGPAEDQLRNAVPRLSAGDLRRLEPYCANPDVLRSRWLAERVAPWYSQRVVLVSHWAPRWLSWKGRIDSQWEGMNPDGFVPFAHQFESAEFHAKATVHAREEYGGVFAGFRFGEASLRAIRDLVARCRAEGIPIAFVEPPVSPMFRAWFRPGVWESGESRLRDFAREPSRTVSAVEGWRSRISSTHHPPYAGATQYSRWLADRHPEAVARGTEGRAMKLHRARSRDCNGFLPSTKVRVSA